MSTLVQYLEERVELAPSGCWEWQRALVEGYGAIGLPASPEGRAHRLAWRLLRGPIPEGLCVLHRCDNRRCVNPEHLFLGTRADNVADMIAKGRNAPSPFARRRGAIPREVVRAIRAAPRGYGTGRELARRYGVSEQAVHDIRRGRSYTKYEEE